MITKITSNDLSVIEPSNYALIFAATWCDSCHNLVKHIEPLSGMVDGKLFNVDVDENGDIAEKYQVKSLPCIIIFKDGKQDMRYENNYNFSELASALSKL